MEELHRLGTPDVVTNLAEYRRKSAKITKVSPRSTPTTESPTTPTQMSGARRLAEAIIGPFRPVIMPPTIDTPTTESAQAPLIEQAIEPYKIPEPEPTTVRYVEFPRAEE